mmetsp:Transcript_8031/g.33563  ORF Transcript_8031/g.33563 Transcript_8031/m.33563 type:complete len:213 (+) Transcript_8031:849-1487(+)
MMSEIRRRLDRRDAFTFSAIHTRILSPLGHPALREVARGDQPQQRFLPILRDHRQVLHRVARLHGDVRVKRHRRRRGRARKRAFPEIHQLARRHEQHALADARQRAPQVRVGEGAQQSSLLVHHEQTPVALAGARHAHQRVRAVGLGRAQRELGPRLHHVADAEHQPLPDAPGGVVQRVLVLGQTLELHQVYRARVPEQQLQRGVRHGRRRG